jgi:anthranilate phosphoribosyltransferase
MDINKSIEHINEGNDLTADEITSVFAEIFTEKCSEQEIADFLVALYKKGESKDEILGAVRYLRSQGTRASCQSTDMIDCCGTGGDQKNTFNISTTVAFVLAGGGCHVAKHGNRAVSSNSGSADILSALGINILASKEVMADCIDEIGIGFLFAPQFYPLMKVVGPIRKKLGHRSIFNILGPLLNPAGAKKQLIGVFDGKLTRLFTEVLQELGSEKAVIVHSEDGLDEFSLTSNNQVSQLKEGAIQDFIFDPTESGYPYCELSDLSGDTPEKNAERLRQCLKGHSLPLDHTVHINAAWGFVAAGKADSFMDGLLLAQESISSGRAYQKLEELIKRTGA